MSQQEYFDLSGDMFGSTAVPFHSFKNGTHKFRVLPPYAPKKLYHKLSIHWGITDESNRVKALQCSKDFENKCPICDMVDVWDKQKVALEQAGRINEMRALEKKVGDNRRKPTYLWNILTAEGESKVLRLSWNGHDPLLNKIKFCFNEKKINVTNPSANWLMYVERSGEKAKTRYVYEPLDNTVKDITGQFKLFDLEKIYRVYTAKELSDIIENGQVKNGEQEHSEGDFLAQLPAAPSAAQSAPQQQPAAATVVPPVQQPVVTQPTAPAPTKVALNNDQEAEVQRMLAMLNGGAKI
jgi:hypothetical protein